MSNRAVHWALEQTHLKPGPWVVLIKLADRHNKDTLRVDPDQARLAADCNMARSTINQHLEKLEMLGLLVRVPRVDPATQKQLSTFYVLAPDFRNPPEIEFAVSDFRTRIAEVQNGNMGASRVSNPDTGAVSEKSPIPCPKNRHSRVRNPDTNLVREPEREPSACDAPARVNARDAREGETETQAPETSPDVQVDGSGISHEEHEAVLAEFLERSRSQARDAARDRSPGAWP